MSQYLFQTQQNECDRIDSQTLSNENNLLHLREELRDIKRQLAVAKHDKNEASVESNQKLSQLKAENGKLQKELSSFTLDFFEEIEDLKFNYIEAKKKLALYEGDESNIRLKKPRMIDFAIKDIF